MLTLQQYQDCIIKEAGTLLFFDTYESMKKPKLNEEFCKAVQLRETLIYLFWRWGSKTVDSDADDYGAL